MTSPRRNVVMEIRADESLHIEVPQTEGAQRITLTLEHKSGHRARLRITAPDDVLINRANKPVLA
ncbi:MAG: hypothetical protein H0W48_00055 [Methylibium sp.]|nr:hypothetical protein [Methylibium sp.]